MFINVDVLFIDLSLDFDLCSIGWSLILIDQFVFLLVTEAGTRPNRNMVLVVTRPSFVQVLTNQCLKGSGPNSGYPA